AHRRLAAELVLHLLFDAHDRLVQLLKSAREADRRPLVAEVPLDLPRHSQRREGRELVAEVRIESFDRLDQAEIPDLHDVVEGLAAVLKLAGQKVDEVVVGLNELRPDAIALGRIGGFLVATMERPQLGARNPRRSSRHPYSPRRSELSLPGA